jgi:hypothetical protein
MDPRSFDHFTRGSLIALAGATLAAATSATEARAGKDGRKDRTRAKQRAAKLCGRQVEPCRTAYSDLCDDVSSPACLELRDAIQACCAHLGECQAGETLACILDVSATVDDRRRRGLRPR